MELELLSQYSVMCVSLFVNMRVKLGQNKRQETNRSGEHRKSILLGIKMHFEDKERETETN